MTEYFFRTELKIRNGINSGDLDPIQINPAGLLKNFLDGCRSMKMTWIHEGYTGSNTKSPKQYIYFLPPRVFRDRIDEVFLNLIHMIHTKVCMELTN
jgi:hypothetical protein